MNNYELTINNQKVFEFYKKNSSLNFEQVNLLCVSLFENILQDANTSLNNSITSQILTECLDHNHKLNEITNEINKINNNITKLNNDLVIKFFDIKKEYIEEVKNIINLNGNEKVDKINFQLRENNVSLKELIEKGNIQLMDKTTLSNHSLINDITNNINNNINKLNSITTSDITNKIERFDDKINIILQKINTESLDKINSLINSSNGIIVDKINLMLNSIIPNNNEKINKQISDEINKFYLMISDETKKLTEQTSNQEIKNFITLFNERTQTENLISHNLGLKQDAILLELTNIVNKNNADQIENFINNFDIKYNSLLLNIQQPILEASTKQQTNQDKMYSSLEEFLDRYRNNSSSKGKYAENHLKLILEENIENAEIIDKSQTAHSCDLLLNRNNKPTILIENKVYTHKVPTVEINKFKSDCKGLKTHGIILSQFSKFTLKNNYQIEIEEYENNKYILVYVCDVKDDFYKIQIAINIIDILADKIKETNVFTDEINSYTIPKNILEEINDEFNKLITQKQNILLLVKDFQKKITISIEEINLPSLKKFIDLSLSLPTDENFNISCNRCNNFVAKNKSSLAAHQKGKECLKIYNSNNNIQEKIEDLNLNIFDKVDLLNVENTNEISLVNDSSNILSSSDNSNSTKTKNTKNSKIKKV
jgi:hypothetical protein